MAENSLKGNEKFLKKIGIKNAEIFAHSKFVSVFKKCV
jgi:hypothetical protein